MAYQKKFWRGESMRTNGREDRIRGNPEAPPMHHGPGEFDSDEPDGADAPKKGTSQPRSKGGSTNDELPMMSQKKKLRTVLRAQALRQHPLQYSQPVPQRPLEKSQPVRQRPLEKTKSVKRMSANGTSTAAIGGGSGSAAGGASE